MLGCQDFCGYYEWTFAHVRSAFGQPAVRDLWSEAIGSESQQAYFAAAKADGLRGLLNVWTQTGHDEGCDWTFTLDERANVLRWDMRNCPSKGFLLDNDLNADEDYCDHCIGWIAPLLDRANIEISRHEHNHRGQCWAEMHVKGKPCSTLDLPIDIRTSASWQNGYLDTFVYGDRLNDDPTDAILRSLASSAASIVSDEQWLNTPSDRLPRAIVLGDDPSLIERIAARWLSIPKDSQPLLLHAYFPRTQSINFSAHALPRPLPLLPILIRAAVYTHLPGSPPLTTSQQAQLLSRAITVLNPDAHHVKLPLKEPPA